VARGDGGTSQCRQSTEQGIGFAAKAAGIVQCPDQRYCPQRGKSKPLENAQRARIEKLPKLQPVGITEEACAGQNYRYASDPEE
jgi:hypothetical protein